MDTIDNSIQAWSEEAERSDKMAELETTRGSSPNAYINQADVARRTVKALKIQKETGVAVCSCCFRPYGEGNKIIIR